MSEKRFVLLCQHFYPEMVSTGLHMTELATRLAEIGWQVTVYCAKPSWSNAGEPEPAPKEIEDRRVLVFRVRTMGGQRGGFLSRAVFAVSFISSAAWALLRSRERGPLVITTNPPFLGVIGWLYSRLRGRPYLLIVYDVYPDIAIELGVVARGSLLAKSWGWLTRRILAAAAVIVVIGRDMSEIVRPRIPRHLHDRLVLIPNWADERRVSPVPRNANGFRRARTGDETFVVQYAGRFGRTHNVEPLVEAAKILDDENVVFQFVGDGPKKVVLERLAAELDVNSVEFLPYQPMDRLAEMLSAADLAVVCLERSFTGLSVPSKAYGVMASGTPILGFVDPESEIGRMISETGCGLVLPDPGAAEIAASLRDLMMDGAKRKAMAEAGRSAFLASYTLARAARAYDAILSSMVNGKSRATT